MDVPRFQQTMEFCGDHRLQEGVLVRIVVIEGGSVYRRLLRDVLHRDFLEVTSMQEVPKRAMKELPRTPDPGIPDFAIRKWHGFKMRHGDAEAKRKTTLDVYLKVGDICRVSNNHRLTSNHL